MDLHGSMLQSLTWELSCLDAFRLHTLPHHLALDRMCERHLKRNSYQAARPNLKKVSTRSNLFSDDIQYSCWFSGVPARSFSMSLIFPPIDGLNGRGCRYLIISFLCCPLSQSAQEDGPGIFRSWLFTRWCQEYWFYFIPQRFNRSDQ